MATAGSSTSDLPRSGFSLDGMGGSSIFRVRRDDVNRNVIVLVDEAADPHHQVVVEARPLLCRLRGDEVEDVAEPQAGISPLFAKQRFDAREHLLAQPLPNQNAWGRYLSASVAATPEPALARDAHRHARRHAPA